VNLEEIEKKILDLSENERAMLAQKLLISLDSLTESQVEQEWFAIARQRAKDLDEGKVQPISADEVRRKAMNLLK